MNNIPSQPIIVCQHLRKSFIDGNIHVEVLKDVNLSVMPKEMIAIVGTSGAGKSTLLHLLGGLDQPTSGLIHLAGRNILQLNEKSKSALRNHTLGFVYQFHHLLPEFTALENVCMPLLIRDMSPKLAIKQAQEMIEWVGLKRRSAHRIGELSGGERQRIAIARALVTRPLCVLADEPTGNLDQTSAQQIYQLMQHFNQTLNTSFVIVTHNMQLASQMNRTLLLQEGVLS